MEIAFRPLRAEELPLLHEWLQRPHVRRWWGDEYEHLESVRKHYLPSIEGRDPADHYLILLDGEPKGMLETYLLSDYPEYEAATKAGAGVAGLDVFIADEQLLGRGLGPSVLRAFVRDVVFACDDVHAVVAGPLLENERSIRAFEKAGFRREYLFDDPEEPGPHLLVRLDRR